MPALRLVVSILLASVSLIACQRSEESTVPPPAPVASPAPASAPFRVTVIELGKAIGTDKRVSAPSSSFAPSDTIYATVATEGASPSVTLVTRWTYQDGQVVNEETQAIAPTGPTVTEFHIAKPDGWPTGRYKVEIALNGQPAGAREFEVR